MKKILAIAILTLRAAVRSRVFAVLAGVVLLCIIGLPLVIKSDGTAKGEIQLYLDYAFGLTILLLSLAATWAGAGAISLEVEGRQMHLLATKPVHSLQIWLGKWIGLTIMNMVLLALTGALIYGILRWNTRTGKLDPVAQATLRSEIFCARIELAPEAPGMDASHPAAGGATDMAAVKTGDMALWKFALPRHLDPQARPQLRFRMTTARPEQISPLSGIITFETAGLTAPLSMEKAIVPNNIYELPVPLAVAAPGSQLTIRFTNAESVAPATVLISGMRLMAPVGGFAGNFVRALLMALARLVFFTAMGVTVGALFSFAVAAFASFGVLLVMANGGLVEQLAAEGLFDAAQGLTATAVNAAIKGMFFMVKLVLPPLSNYDPLIYLPDAALIPWSVVFHSGAVLIGGYALVWALLGAWLFSRREIGLPA